MTNLPPRPSRPTSREQLTPSQVIEQRLAKKILRLNRKLTKVKTVAVTMLKISARHNDISSHQVQTWAKEILNILGSKEEDTK